MLEDVERDGDADRDGGRQALRAVLCARGARPPRDVMHVRRGRAHALEEARVARILGRSLHELLL